MKEDVAKAIVSAEIAVYGVQWKESAPVSRRGMHGAAASVLGMIVGIAVL